MGTLNVRSVRMREKWLKLQAQWPAETDVMILTETWLNRSIVNYVSHAHAVQSPPCNHQGILMLLKEPAYNVQPVLPDLWDSCTIAVKIHYRHKSAEDLSTVTKQAFVI